MFSQQGLVVLIAFSSFTVFLRIQPQNNFDGFPSVVVWSDYSGRWSFIAKGLVVWLGMFGISFESADEAVPEKTHRQRHAEVVDPSRTQLL